MNPRLYILTRILFCLFLIDTLTIKAQCISEGNILREFWTNVPGDNISDFPTDDPDGSSHPTIFEGNTNSGDNYAERFRGYICVPQTGQYTFWIASNNDGELWLSLDENPVNKVKIAFVDGYTNYREWTKYASQKSGLINLTAGQRYYIEALHKEGTQGDHVSVGWQLPNATFERPIPGNRLSPFNEGSSGGTITTDLIAVNAQWRYLDNGSNQGTAWRTIGFNDAGWKSGYSELGYGDGDEATKVSYGPSKSNKYITTYFRKSFNVSNASSFTELELGLLRDDGAVVYLNGTQVYRSNMPTGTITYTIKASSDVSGSNEDKFFTSQINTALLVNGVNVIAVEIHQRSGGSSDISFNFGLKGTYIEQPPCTPDSWTQKTSFGTPRYSAIGFSIGDKGYMGLGRDNYVTENKKDFWEYNPKTEIWTQKADYPGLGSHFVAAFGIGTKGYVGTGTSVHTVGARIQYHRDFWEYNPQLNQWNKKSDFEGTERYSAVAFSIGDKGYLGTGIDNYTYAGVLKDFWEYDPKTDVWNRKKDFGGNKRAFASGFSINNKGYIGLGISDADGGFEDFWEYNPGTDTWIQKNNFNGGKKFEATGISIGNFGYIIRGRYPFGGETTNELWKYNSENDSWTLKSEFQGDNSQTLAVGFSIDCKAYLGIGSEFWEYCSDAPSVYVGITSPGDSSLISTDHIEITANALACNSGISKIEFYSNNVLIGKDSIFPYSFNWTNIIAGNYTLKAKVIPAIGNFEFSNEVPIEVQPDTIVQCENEWERLSNFDGLARTGATGFVIGQFAYIGTGGESNSDEKYKDFWKYNSQNDSWTQVANFSGAERSEATSFVIGNLGYVGTGRAICCIEEVTVEEYKDFWKYDPVNNRWTEIASLPGIERYRAISFAIGNKGYIGTGLWDGGVLEDFWEYDPLTNQWVQKSNFPEERQSSFGFSSGTKGFLLAGSNTQEYNDLWSYNPVKDKWSEKAPIPGDARTGASGFVINNYAFVGLGSGPTSLLQDFWRYDINNDSWSQVKSFQGTGRNNAVGFSLNCKGFIATGDDPATKIDVWKFCPDSVPPLFVSISSPGDSAEFETPANIIITSDASIPPVNYIFSLSQM